ncbi:MAG: tyrosine--tRNA ligase [Saprospiraceae bacterium]|nr:tyrosine--tRNA ligase [Saprospiraceae bacterium]
MDFLQELEWRGMIHNKIDGVEEYLSTPGQRGYIGFDPTAKSLTIGNLVQIMILSFFKMSGHQPIVLMGGATGRIGDPSGKDKERQLLDYQELDKNLAAQTEQVKKLLSFDEGPEPVFVNNYDFYKDMNVLEYLRDLGKTLTVNYMMSKDSVKNRLEVGLSYTEFSYQVLQGYDFLKLYRSFDCALQMGGSDQWGNITTGTEFIRRSEEGAKVYAVTTPLLTKSDGSKFGKSEGDNIWLDPEMTSPYEFYQFWINADDADLSKLFRYFSLLSKDEIETLERETSNPNNLKRMLAEEMTTRVHSSTACERAKRVSELIFGRKTSHEEVMSFDHDTIDQVARVIPSFELPSELIGKETIALLAENTDIFSSKSEVQRSIKGNALAVNKEKVVNMDHVIESGDIIAGSFVFIENGKKNKYILKFI